MSPETTTAPLLQPPQAATKSLSGGRPNALSLLLGRASGRHGASKLVRDTALDIIWNLSFVAVSVVMLIRTLEEKPNVPVRVWICGYSLQCAVHVVQVLLEYTRRNRGSQEEDTTISTGGSDSHVNDSDEDGTGFRVRVSVNSFGISYTKRSESVFTMVPFVWWLIGFYWVVSGGDILLHVAPRLYWLTVVFLAFDVFSAIYSVVLACLIGIALCVCLPCITAVLYAVGLARTKWIRVPNGSVSGSNNTDSDLPSVHD